jgi:hypothetical protein
MSFTLGKKQTFDRNAAERRKVDQVGVLGAVPETPARGDERIFQGECADPH